MPPRKKKTEPKIPVPVYRESRMSIDPALIGGLRRFGRTPLDVELESEDNMMAREIKEMRVEEMNQKRKLRVAKLQKEIDKLEKENESIDSDKSDNPRISVAMAQQIANLPPEERNKVIETYAMFSSIDRSKGKGDSMLPLLIGFSKSNPGTPQINMLDYAKAMGDQLKTGIDLAKAFTSKEKPSNAMEFMKVMKDVIIEGVRNPILQALKDSQPTQGVFEQILTNPEMFTRMKTMGLFGSGESRTGSTNIDLEIEKLRGERQLEITKLNLDVKKTILELEAKERRSNNIMTMLAPLTAIVAGPVSQRMQQLGEKQGAAHIPPVTVPNVSTDTTILLQCSCGYEGPMTFTGPPPSLINCPQCGGKLIIGGTQPGKPE